MTRVVWQQVSQAVEKVLDEIMLAELRDEAQALAMQGGEVG